MIRRAGCLAAAAMGPWLAASPADAHLMWCRFVPDCPADRPCEGFDLIIDTHHAPDGPTLTRDGVTVPMVILPDDDARFPSYVTHADGGREMLSLLGGHAAAYSRHLLRDGLPVSEAATGDCFD
jgi:hypothetical protein